MKTMSPFLRTSYRVYGILFLCAWMYIPCSAAVRTPEQAIEIASAHASVHRRKLPIHDTVVSDNINASLAYQSPAFYAVNTSGGYVLVSADDRLTPILGYSESNTPFHMDSIPPAMRYWLEEYETEYAILNAHLKQAGTPTHPGTQRSTIAGGDTCVPGHSTLNYSRRGRLRTRTLNAQCPTLHSHHRNCAAHRLQMESECPLQPVGSLLRGQQSCGSRLRRYCDGASDVCVSVSLPRYGQP